MKVLTYNIMTAGKDLFPTTSGWWFTRTINTMKMIYKETPDVFCFNESTPFQQLLFCFFKGYKCYGWYTQNPVFIKKEYKVNKVECKKYKLSSKYHRSYTLVNFKNSDNTTYTVIGTHLDWDVEPHACQKLKLYELVTNNKHDIVFVCGDFNVFNERFNTIVKLTSANPDKDTFSKGGKIDYIFNNIGIDECTVLNNYNMSDHYPVFIEY